MKIGDERCEYNPTLKKPAMQNRRLTDCIHSAVWSLGNGEDDEWHLCSQCAKRVEFRKYKVRKWLLNDN